MRFFFYGTLLDKDVRNAVLGTSSESHKGVPAELPGFARRRARHGDYPVLVRRRGSSVRGEIFEGLSPSQILMIAHFEGPKYCPGATTVTDCVRQERRSAWVFLPFRRNDKTARAWNERIWAQRAKPVLIRDIHRWAREFNVGTLQSQDLAWPARRRLMQIFASQED